MVDHEYNSIMTVHILTDLNVYEYDSSSELVAIEWLICCDVHYKVYQ